MQQQVPVSIEAFQLNSTMHVDQDGRSFALLSAYANDQQPHSSSSFIPYTQANDQMSSNVQVSICSLYLYKICV